MPAEINKILISNKAGMKLDKSTMHFLGAIPIIEGKLYDCAAPEYHYLVNSFVIFLKSNSQPIFKTSPFQEVNSILKSIRFFLSDNEDFFQSIPDDISSEELEKIEEEQEEEYEDFIDSIQGDYTSEFFSAIFPRSAQLLLLNTRGIPLTGYLAEINREEKQVNVVFFAYLDESYQTFLE